jgi:hypothetical protein
MLLSFLLSLLLNKILLIDTSLFTDIFVRNIYSELERIKRQLSFFATTSIAAVCYSTATTTRATWRPTISSCTMICCLTTTIKETKNSDYSYSQENFDILAKSWTTETRSTSCLLTIALPNRWIDIITMARWCTTTIINKKQR